MNILLILSFISLTIFSCETKSDKKRTEAHYQLGEFELSIDTMDINIKPYISCPVKISLTHAVKYGEKYYCFFTENWASVNHDDLKHFLIISKDGIIEKRINVPDIIQNSYYFDLFILHDSIFTKAYMEHNTYYLDQKASKWIETKEVDDIIYEDNRFYVTYLDFGEWGCTTWFIDKSTSREYEIASEGTIINKLNGTYYITSGTQVLSIEDPLKLNACKPEYSYRLKGKLHNGSQSLIGTKIIYEDTSYSKWINKKPKNRIATSFLYNNQLLHLCVDSTDTFIARIENGKLKSIQKIGESYSIFNWYYSYRGKIQKDNSQLLKFETKDDKYGFIEISDNRMNIRYLKLLK